MKRAQRPSNEHITSPLGIISQGAKVGAAAAVPGFAIGGIFGTLRTTTPIFFSVVSGLQWFAIGTTFWSVRTSILDNVGVRNWWNMTRGAPFSPRPEAPHSREDKLKASTISGSVTGAFLGLVLRGPRNVIPGTIMFTLFGYGGQKGYDWFEQRRTDKTHRVQELQKEGKEELNWLQRLTQKKWSPMSILTDEQYEEMLNEKILGVEVEIAMIDDKIKEFRRLQEEAEKKQLSEKGQTQSKQ
ncbi:uncharacterized protein EI97DRAFT_433213 [Westerdykella ornata]|uniref:Uncharacterized protein n=1 Tax=Westerdykella ornata TaxID=318751 RepID=A0A6A6JIV1_WESOR|nr:uncharacterized protein EI97DRAFT_433213 [Westerdykella ornata]KAF2276372.1 hypothetical protein EI97DRAFT_433213 [Westerdykella ornata]